MTHVFELDQRRENLAIQRPLTGMGIPPATSWLQHVGWNPANCWFALNIPTSSLLSDVPDGTPGDLDVVGGPLEAPDAEWAENMTRARAQFPYPQPDEVVRSLAWNRCLERGEIVWPPRMEQVAVAEFKAGRFEVDGTFKSKSHRDAFQQHARGQAQGLCNRGFHRVALIHVLGGAPHAQDSDPDGLPWLRAAGAAQQASWAFGGKLLIGELDPFATLVLPFAAVTGNDETFDGAAGPAEFWNDGVDNPASLNPGSVACRDAITSQLDALLGEVAVRTRLPVLVLACSSGRCGNLYVSNRGSPECACPRCGRPPTVTAT